MDAAHIGSLVVRIQDLRAFGLPIGGRSLITAGGQVVEWSMAPHSKCGEPARAPWVRIPPCPPIKGALAGPFLLADWGAVDDPLVRLIGGSQFGREALAERSEDDE